MKSSRIKEKLCLLEGITPVPKVKSDAEIILDIRENLDRLFKVIVDYKSDYGLKWSGGLLRYVDDKEDRTSSKWLSNNHWERGHVLEVELFGHFMNELTFAHPCVVLFDSGSTWALVAPISTPRHGDASQFTVDIDEADGMNHACGVCIDAIRVIDKRRVYYQHKKNNANSKIRSEKLDLIDAKILELYLPKTHEVYTKTQTELENERTAHEQLKHKHAKLQEAYDKLNSELNENATHSA